MPITWKQVVGYFFCPFFRIRGGAEAAESAGNEKIEIGVFLTPGIIRI